MISPRHKHDFTNSCKLKLGPKASNFLDNRQKMILQWRPKNPKAATKKRTKTALSSTPRGQAQQLGKGKQRAAPEEDAIELYQDDSASEASDPEEHFLTNSRARKRVWPPLREASTRAPARPTSTSVEITSQSENPTPSLERNFSIPLYDQMLELRRRVY